MKNHRKVITALVGVALMILNTWFDASELVNMQGEIVNLVIAGLATAGVYQFKNEG